MSVGCAATLAVQRSNRASPSSKSSVPSVAGAPSPYVNADSRGMGLHAALVTDVKARPRRCIYIRVC
jgi:hypothetical protein